MSEDLGNIKDPINRHKIATGKHLGQIAINMWDHYADIAKTRFPKSYTKYFDRTALVAKASQTLQRVNSSWFMNIARTKIGKGGLVAAGGIIAWNLIGNSLKQMLPHSPVIPNNYERGYDMLDETLTDFGSPVHLLKTASHIITPYHSSIRKSVITTTGAITKKNIALFNNANAIKHSQY